MTGHARVRETNLLSSIASEASYPRSGDDPRHTGVLLVRKREEALGKERPDTLTSINNLTSVPKSQGSYDEAEQINRRTLASRETVLSKKQEARSKNYAATSALSSVAFTLCDMGTWEVLLSANTVELLLGGPAGLF